MTDPKRTPIGSPDSRECIEFAGFLLKRRGGFGKYALAGLAWQERYVTISKQGLLTYYEGDPHEPGEEVKEKPRGRIDLRTVVYEFLKDFRSEVSYILDKLIRCP